jgi:hypothetical protein
MIAFVVLAMSVGPAFASVCAGSTCDMDAVCAPATNDVCVMESGPAMMHALCTHQAGHDSSDLVPVQPGPDGAAAVVPLIGAIVFPAAPLGVRALPLADARGAPHLTSVLRI